MKREIKNRKCNTCKREFRSYNGFARCPQCRVKASNAKKEKHKLTKTYQRKTIKKLRKKAWKLMSEWIRRKDADKNGKVECYTCGKSIYWQEAHAGHFKHGCLDYDERNLKVQCPSCNTYHNGRLDIYAVKLIEQHSIEWVKELERDARTEKRLDIPGLETIIKELELKLKKLND